LFLSAFGLSLVASKAGAACAQPITELLGVTFSADGTRLAVAGKGGFRVFRQIAPNKWTSETGAQGNDFDYAVSFAPHGQMLAVGCSDGTVEMRDSNRSMRLQTMANLSMSAIAFSPDGGMLAAVGCRLNRGSPNPLVGIAEVWDVSTGRRLAALGVSPYTLNCVAFSPDGKRIAVGGAGLHAVLELWDISTETRLRRLETAASSAAPKSSSFNTWIWAVVFSPDGSTLIASDSGGSKGHYTSALESWDVASGRRVKVVIGDFRVAYSPNGDTRAQASESLPGWKVDLYSVPTGGRKTTFLVNSAVHSMCFSPTGDMLACGTSGCTVDIWRVATGNHLTTLNINR
jgi:WD40 repeat protein